MSDLELPSLYCPFASRISPHVAALEAENVAWLERLALVPSGGGAVIARARFGELAARAYPDASLELLAIAAAWATWLFLRDDQCDEGGISSDPRALRELSDREMDVLAGKRNSDANPLTAALADLRTRMLAHGGGRWMGRFLANVQDYFDASIWEADNRARGVVPDVATYVCLRDLTGAVKTCFDIFELVEAPLSVSVRHDDRLAQLMKLANRAICWSNDLFSVRKELAHGDVHNLVIVLQRERSLSMRDAILAAARMHDDAVRSFVARTAQLADAPVELQHFVRALEGWVRANVDWSIGTGRYAARDAHGEASAMLAG